MLLNLACKFARSLPVSVRIIYRVGSVRMVSSGPLERKSTRITEYLTLNQYHPFETGSGKTPTVLFLPWITATPRAAQHFEDLYGHRGFNVLTVRCKAKYFMWPRAGLPVAARVMEYMRTEVNGDIIVHGMSIGAYLYALMVMIATQDQSFHGFFKEHIKGNVFDSIVYGGPTKMAAGLSKMMSHSAILERVITTGLLTYLALTRPYTQRILDASIQAFLDNPYLPSAMIMYTTIDPMADYKMIEDMGKSWEDRGVHVEMKKWTDSWHAELFKSHPHEYIKSLDEYLAFIKPTLTQSLKSKL